ncbi:MAG: translation initiation factor [Vicinamibacterales bacterium]
MPFHNPFDVLRDLRGPSPDSPTPPESPQPAPAPSTPLPARVARAVVRMERSGRGGKIVTVVEHLGLPPAEREVWLKALKGALGCGGTVDGEALVLQGDQRRTLPAWLTARGVKKVTVS